MKDILRDIIADKRIEVEKLKKDISIDNLYNNATELCIKILVESDSAIESAFP